MELVIVILDLNENLAKLILMIVKLMTVPIIVLVSMASMVTVVIATMTISANFVKLAIHQPVSIHRVKMAVSV
jgi:hypothetical protein